MKLDKQQQQYVIIAVLFLIIIVIVLFQMGIFSGGAKKPAETKKEQTTTTPSESVKSTQTDGAKTGSAASTASANNGTYLPNQRRDPFFIQSFGLKKPEGPIQTKKPVSAFIPKTPILPDGMVKPANPFAKNGTLPGGITIKVAPPQLPVLTGVLLGANNTALITYKGKSYIVNQGKTFAGRYRLVKVMKDSVLLQDGSKQIRIGLGGSK